jgi:hypothetical protein
VRTRIYLTDIGAWEQAGRAHGEIFRDIRPVCSMLQVSRLIDPAMLVEIEADAIVLARRSGPRRGAKKRPRGAKKRKKAR